MEDDEGLFVFLCGLDDEGLVEFRGTLAVKLVVEISDSIAKYDAVVFLLVHHMKLGLHVEQEDVLVRWGK